MFNFLKVYPIMENQELFNKHSYLNHYENVISNLIYLISSTGQRIKNLHFQFYFIHSL